MRALCMLALASACGSAAPPSEPPRPRPAPTPAPIASCGASTAAIDGEVGLPAAWRVPRGNGTGGFGFELDGDRVIARTQGGRTLSVQLADGACAVLVEAPPAQGAIDPYSTQSAVLNGALVGPLGSTIAAADLTNGALLWRHDLAFEHETDAAPQALRDQLRAVAVGGVDVIGYPELSHAVEPYEWIDHLAGIDPESGAVLWQAPVVRHRPGDATGSQDHGYLYRALDRVLVDRAGALSALDPHTGQVAWSVTAPGPVLTSCGRVLAGDSLYDARTGALVRRIEGHVPLAHTCGTDDRDPPSATCAGDWTYAGELDPSHGTTLLAIDPDGQIAWTRPIAGCLLRVRATASAVYVMEGVARLWALDAHDGHVLWGLTSGRTSDFLVAPSAEGARVVLPFEDLIAIDVRNGEQPRAQDPYLRWRFGGEGDACRARSIAWLDGQEQVVWERALPTRAQGSCGTDGASFHRTTPRWQTAVPVLYLEGAVALDDPSGLLIVRTADGATVLDEPRGPGDETLSFDDGRFELDGTPPCSGLARSGRIFALCGAYLLHFDGHGAALVDTQSWQVVARGTFDGRPSYSGHGQVEATIMLGDRQLHLTGMIYM